MDLIDNNLQTWSNEVMEMEVICLSSDDELNSQKENIKNKSVINSTEIVKTANKLEVLTSDDEKIEENNRKRKLSQINKEEIIHNKTEKKKKLDINQDTSKMIKTAIPEPKLCLKSDISKVHPVAESDYTTNKDKKVIETNLFEIDRTSYITYNSFPSFLSLCLQNTQGDEKKDMEIIVNKLKRRYDLLEPAYIGSKSFDLFINEKREAITKNDKRKYLLIEEVMNEMKRSIRKKPKADEYDAVPSTSYAANNLKSNNNITESDCEDDIAINVSSKTKRKIKQVLHAMKKCEAAIKKLEEVEVDFNEENDSSYIKVEKYKQRMVELYNKHCELTGDNTDAGRAYLRPKHVNPTRIPAVDHAITLFINDKITKRNEMKKVGALPNDLIFPDYRDILNCVTRSNDTKNLGLEKRKLEQLAKKAFQELGEHLQRSRQNDYWDTFSLYLDNAKEDPAVKDQALARKLADNRMEGEKRLAAVFEKYAQQQKEIKEQDNDDETASEEEVEEEEEEEEDDDDDDDDDDDEEEEEEEVEEEEEDEEVKEEKKKKEKEKKDEKGEESIVNDEDKSQNNVPVISLSDEDNVTEDIDKTIEDIAKIIKKKKFIEKDKNNINIVNQDIDILNKTSADKSPEQCDEKVKIVSAEKSDVISENETFNNTEHNPSINNNTVDSKIQKDLLPTSTTNCENNINRTEENLTEAVMQDAPKVITCSMEEVVTRDIADATTTDVANINKDAAEMITGNGPETIGGENDVIDKVEITETDMTETTDVTDTTDVIIENVPSGNQSEEEKKPLLRVRSFAKPPTTWKDNQHNANKAVQENVPKIINQMEEVIDLTDETTTRALTKETKAKKSPVITKCAIKVGDKLFPVVKKKTLIFPSKNNLITVHNITNVQNITKNYLKVNKRTGQIISSVGNIHGPKIIRLPSSVQVNQQQNQQQNTNTVITRQEVPLRRNETIIKVVPPGKPILLPKKKTVQVTIPVSEQSESPQATKPK
ncbi:glutamic acid-rich protein-like [Linepithema humile]|uniref:glutamic acid-rich protein-like n=1 Tax=Linepithema humile TaxID=83485 RepID=UPI00351F20BE